jgi:hypothetical protein
MPTAKTGEVTILPGSNLTSWEDGLTKAQLDAVEKCVESVATISCKTYKDMAAAFAELKDALPDGNWVKWTNSVELNVGARTIQDLAAANVWLESTAIDDAKIGRLSARALCMIANCNKAKQKQCETQLLKGKVLSFKAVQEIIVGAKDGDSGPSSAARIKALEAQLAASMSFTRAQVAAADAAMEERDELKRQVERLTNLLEQALDSSNLDDWQKKPILEALQTPGWKVDTVMTRSTSDKAMALFRDKEPATSKS